MRTNIYNILICGIMMVSCLGKEADMPALPSRGPSGRLCPHRTFTGVHLRLQPPQVGGTHHEKDPSPCVPTSPQPVSPNTSNRA